MNKEMHRRYILGFERAQEEQEKAFESQGPNPAWSIRASLSMIAAMQKGMPSFSELSERRRLQDEHVSKIWKRLREKKAA